MSGIAHLLDDFAPLMGRGPDSAMQARVLAEDQRLAAFEEGYKAGWADSAKSQVDDRTRISAELARNLQDLTFTYHEAQAHVLRDMTPLLQQMVLTVLPKLAHDTLATRVIEELSRLAATSSSSDVEVVCAPRNETAIESLTARELPFPVSVRSDPDLGDGQVHLRFAEVETMIDLDDALAGIDRAVAGFLHETRKDESDV